MRAHGLVVVLAVLLAASVQAACGGAPAQPAVKAPAAASSPSAGAGAGTDASVGRAPGEASAAAAASVPARPKEPVNFAIPQKSMNYIVPIAAAALGYFDEAGLEFSLQPLQANLTVAALQRGDLQISGAGGSAVRAAVRGGAPFKVVTFMAARPTYFLLTVPEVRTPQQLVGKRIGVTNVGDSLSYYLDTYARQRGIDSSQITVLGMGPDPAAHLVAMHAGALDGGVLDPASAAVGEVQGFHILQSLGEVTAQPIQSIVVTEEFMQTKPESLRGFLKALVRGLLYVKQQPRETAAIARRELTLDMDEATALRAVQLYGEAIWAEAPGYADERMMETFYQLDVRVPLEMGPDEPIPVLHDFRYLLEAYDALGIARPR